MQVILLQKVPSIGNSDDVKEVAEGYARNYLFPRHLAVQASSQALKTLRERQERVHHQAERDLREQQALAARLDGFGLELKERASAKGALYAAVTAAKVADKLLAKGHTVTKDQIQMKPIKEAGIYPVKLKFRHGLEAEIQVIIQPL